MSGIYLVVWDNTSKDKSPVLRPTKGGWPHVTLAYTGRHLSPAELTKTAAECFRDNALVTLTLARAEVNSFEDRPGHTRHDVLLMLDDASERGIEALRVSYLKTRYANHADFTMRTPHVTYGIYEDREEAEAMVHALKAAFPYHVTVTGVTID